MSTRISIVPMLLLCAVCSARADVQAATGAGANNLQFIFGGLSTLATNAITVPAQGTNPAPLTTVFGAGYRYFLSSGLALRATFGLILNSTTTKVAGLADSTGSTSGVMLAVGGEKHFGSGSVSPYAGAQLGFVTGTGKRTPSHPTNQSGVTTSVSGSDFIFGVYGGAEWFIAQAISLGAEYQLGFILSSSKTEVSGGANASTTDGPSGFSFGTNAVGVLLNVYLGR